MKRIQYIYILITAMVLFAGCSKEDVPATPIDLGKNEIAIRYSPNSFKVINNTTRSSELRATEVAGSPAENQIDNLYILLFKMDGTNPVHYYTGGGSTSIDGEWLATGDNAAEPYVKLKLSPSQAGTRLVYVVANVTDIKAKLEAVTTETELKEVFKELSAPWSTNLTTPILMSGSATNNFTADKQLKSVALVRAWAKVELDITLPDKHKSSTPAEYKHQFTNFDKNSLVVKPETKTSDTDGLVTSGWIDWTASGNVTTYTKNVTTDKVEKLTLVTYLNEVEGVGTMIEIQLPVTDGGLLPPPEFGPETFRLPLPDKVERNNWYKYDVEL